MSKTLKLSKDCHFISSGKPITIPEGTEIIVSGLLNDDAGEQEKVFSDEFVKDFITHYSLGSKQLMNWEDFKQSKTQQ